MGFSVSGAFAIVAIGFLITVGMVYSAAWEHVEHVSDAKQQVGDSQLKQANTDIAILRTAWFSSNTTLLVTVNNTGTSVLVVSRTDILVDGEYITHDSLSGADEELSVNDDTEPTVWRPGEQLQIKHSVDPAPSRVKIITGPGVGAAEAV